MSIENKKVIRVIVVAVVSCFILSLYSYIFDCIYNFSYAKHELFDAIVTYLFFYFVLRIWGIFGIIILFNILSKVSQNIYFKVFKIILITVLCAVLGKYVGKNDWNNSIGGSLIDGIDVARWKYIYVYPIAALTMCVFYEWLNYKKPLKDSASSVS